jgi:hypothetical protein
MVQNLTFIAITSGFNPFIVTIVDPIITITVIIVAIKIAT